MNYILNIYSFGKFFFLLYLSLVCIYTIFHFNYSNTKVCICTIGKNENKYIREFVEYYKKFGIDKIFLYDNNDNDGENFDIVLDDYIKSGFVEIINYRGKEKIQYSAFNHCYRGNNHSYDWLIFYDLDEFIHLSHYSNVKNFLDKPTLKNCNIIYLYNVLHTDNNQIYYYNKSLFERFPNFTTEYPNILGITKIIMRGNLSDITFNNPHVIPNKYQCNGIGKIINLTNKEIYNKRYYYNHFYFKSSEEYFNKLKRGGITSGKKVFVPNLFEFYFSVNKLTKEKIDYFEKMSGLNLTEYRARLIK